MTLSYTNLVDFYSFTKVPVQEEIIGTFSVNFLYTLALDSILRLSPSAKNFELDIGIATKSFIVLGFALSCSPHALEIIFSRVYL